MKKTLLAWLVVSLCGFSGAAHAVILTLDNIPALPADKYKAVIEPDVTLQQPLYFGTSGAFSNFITGDGLWFDTGPASSADFDEKQTKIGWDFDNPVATLGGLTPYQLVVGNVWFAIKAEVSGNLYNARLLWFRPGQMDDGFNLTLGAGIGGIVDDMEVEDPYLGEDDLFAGAQFDIREVTSVPEPASLILLGLGLVGIGFSRRKAAA